MSKLDQIKALREAKASRAAAPPPEYKRPQLGEVGGGAKEIFPARRGRPRIGEARDKPWEREGMSRRTWYRRKAEARK